jgi:hypothetical protein
MRKLERIIALILLLIIVIATNVMDNTSFKIVKESIGNMYEDRLVAYDLTYKIHNEVEERRMMLLKGDVSSFKATNGQFTLAVDSLIKQYGTTELTIAESDNFDVLKERLAELEGIEKTYISEEGTEEKELREKVEAKSAKIVESLNALAAIQISEGKRQLINSERAVKSSDVLSKVEIVSMIVISIIIVFLIIYEPKI